MSGELRARPPSIEDQAKLVLTDLDLDLDLKCVDLQIRKIWDYSSLYRDLSSSSVDLNDDWCNNVEMEELSDWHNPVRLEDTLGEVDTDIIEVNIIGEMMEIIVIDEVTI